MLTVSSLKEMSLEGCVVVQRRSQTWAGPQTPCEIAFLHNTTATIHVHCCSLEKGDFEISQIKIHKFLLSDQHNCLDVSVPSNNDKKT